MSSIDWLEWEILEFWSFEGLAMELGLFGMEQALGLEVGEGLIRGVSLNQFSQYDDSLLYLFIVSFLV